MNRPKTRKGRVTDHVAQPLGMLFSFGGLEQQEDNSPVDETQGWACARHAETQSIRRVREALVLRGEDRLRALSLASVYSASSFAYARAAGGAA